MQGGERQVRLVLGPGGLDDLEPGRALPGVAQQSALADAGLATQDQGPAQTVPRGVRQLGDAPDLVLPSDERPTGPG